MNKQYLIKITGEDNLWYDSEEKVYRKRLYCDCGKVAGCRCYPDLFAAQYNEDFMTCSYKCALKYSEWDGFNDACIAIGVRRGIKDLTIEELKLIVSKFERWVVLEAMQELEIYKKLEALTKEEVIKIFEHCRDDTEEVIFNCNINMGKTIEDLTEEEAIKILKILADDADYDYSSGEVCNT